MTSITATAPQHERGDGAISWRVVANIAVGVLFSWGSYTLKSTTDQMSKLQEKAERTSERVATLEVRIVNQEENIRGLRTDLQKANDKLDRVLERMTDGRGPIFERGHAFDK